jgi:DNA helicase-2/ATP-dependent DNA helicase PcrA
VKSVPSGSIDYVRQLNAAQYQAVTSGDGPVLVVAGAGSGKTRTLVYRVAWLVEQGAEPETVLLLTFTRRAANEMLTRASAMLDFRCQHVLGGTFHWLANRLLHRYGLRLAFDPNFTILDRGDAEDVINFLAGSLGLREQHRHFPKKHTIADIFSKAVNRAEPLADVLVREYDHFLQYREELAALWERYGLYKRQNQVMDFDDLLLYFARLLQEREDVRQEISCQYRYLLVDEYQDTNRLQAEIVRALAAAHRNVMVVGDDSQAIYAFRGAHYRNILDFPKLFPEAKIYKLEENYRSTQPILDVANGIIQSAREKYTKCLRSQRGTGTRPLLVRPADEGKQSDFVCDRVREYQRRGLTLRDMAVLFRASFHSFDLEVALTRAGIPFVKYGGFRFVEAAHIKDVLAHLRAWRNPQDRISWHRLLLLVDKVGAKRSQEIISHLLEEEAGPERLRVYAQRLPARHGLHRLVHLFEELSQPGLTVSQQVRAVRTYYEPILVAKHDDYPKRLRELDYLQDWTVKYHRLEDFLADVALEPPTASLPEGHPQLAEDHLVLSTIHSAKGLEWRAVFVISAVDGRLPSGHAFGDEEMLEEERRLLYVAVTRAKDFLFVCAPEQTYDRASGFRPAHLSLFLRQVPGQVFSDQFQEETTTQEEERTGEGGQGRFVPGDIVRHPFFGRGRVLATADGVKVRVRFEDGHTRLLHLDFAPLMRVNPLS